MRNPDIIEVDRPKILDYGFFFDEAGWDHAQVNRQPQWYKQDMQSRAIAKAKVDSALMKRMKSNRDRPPVDLSQAGLAKFRRDTEVPDDVTDEDLVEALDPLLDSNLEDEYDLDDLEDDGIQLLGS